MGKTLRQIDDETPNGFHDARLFAFSVDLVEGNAKLNLDMLVGGPEGKTYEEREGYRRATLILDGLFYFVIDPPDIDREFCDDRGVFIDAGDATETDNPRAPRPIASLPPGASAYWFYIHDWNSFIHVAARSASLEWE